jgi:hypothetical protein
MAPVGEDGRSRGSCSSLGGQPQFSRSATPQASENYRLPGCDSLSEHAGVGR